MTIRLLTSWGAYPCSAIVTLDSVTEASLVAAKTASTDLTGGVVWAPPTDKPAWRDVDLMPSQIADGATACVAQIPGPSGELASMTYGQVTAAKALVSGDGNAPATLDATNAATYNGATVKLAAGATLTVHDGAWALLAAELVIKVGQSGSATLAFSGTAAKENSSGTSASSVTLAASGVYALTRSPTGSPLFRLTGGASL